MLDQIPTELKYVLIMAAIVLFQYVLKRFGPQPAEQSPEPPAQDAADIPENEATETPPTQTFPGVVASRFGRTAEARVARPRAGRRYSRSSLMGSRRRTQNAIVIATILGPCRAFESHDSR